MTTQHTDEMREAFEARFAHKNLSGCTGTNVNTSTGKSREVWLYHSPSTQAAWEAWQACATRYEAALREARVALEMYAASDNGAYQLLNGFKGRVGDVCPRSPANKALATINSLLGEKHD